MLQVPALHTEGVTGDGIFIGVLDTGFNLNHEALESTQVVTQWDFINWDSVTSNEPGQDWSTQHNHGTMILGIIGGFKRGVYSGVAFGAEFALAKTEDISSETPVEEDYWVMGLEWLDSLGVDLVTSSLGYIDWYDYEDIDGNTAITTIAADMAVANGLSVFTAMGNGGATAYPYAIAPADGDSVMSIGGVDSLESYWPSSSRGPTYDGRIKPEIVTQGSRVYCINPNDSTAYGRASGTSCATPLAAGGGALILQKNPGWNPIQLREAIRATGTNSASPDTFIGWGILQADDASDFIIVSVVEESPVPGQLESTLIRIESVPNPFNPHTLIYVQVASTLGNQTVSAGVFDVAGRCVRDFGLLGVQSGSATIVWDGTDGAGKLLSSGTYFFTVRTGDASETRKLLLLR
jgi:subtilisin family serine protease